jgi:transaldolase/glucose-6-phosphate isomerase
MKEGRENPLRLLQEYGQSFWLDYIRRSLITGGELERLVKEEGLRGLTSNSFIFQKAIAGSAEYDVALSKSIPSDPRSLYEELAFEDIRMAADILRPVYEETDGADGFVCIDLPPAFAQHPQKHIDEGRRIWRALKRPNIMIKVPAASQGIPVIETLISEGINVDVVLIFSLSQYEAAARAYLRGLEKCPAPHKVASAASFSISQVDCALDRVLAGIGTAEALKLRGRIASASARMVYQRYKEIFSGETWKRLEHREARTQRPLWASTGIRNPSYSDVFYVEELIGPHTINAMDPATFNAFRDHGRVRLSLQEDLEEAAASLQTLSSLGVNFKKISDQLQAEGVTALSDSFEELLYTIKEKSQRLIRGHRERQKAELGEHKNLIEKRLKSWLSQNFIRRLWAKDHTLWSSELQPEIVERLGWLVLPEVMDERAGDFIDFASKIKEEGISRVVLLGMGGSSLAPEVFQKTFGNAAGYPELIVLDSTHPFSVRALDDSLDLARSLFLVSSKSGTTLETLSLFRYFWNRVKLQVGRAGHHFAAVTDPGSPLARMARERGFRKVFEAPADVGGRYSALADFGLVAAALIGMDVHKLLERARVASENNAFCVSAKEASGLVLGASLGELATIRNKLTIFTSESLRHFPFWLEQLIAESTGKRGKGILPVVMEPLISPDRYGKDRFFVCLSLEGEDSRELEDHLSSLEKNAHPVVRINLAQKYDLGQELFRWEIAVAAAGSVLGINPFNQPDVQLAKDLTRELMEGERERKRGTGYDAEIYTFQEPESLIKGLRDWIRQVHTGDYIALQAYISPLSETTAALQDLRFEFLKQTGLATTIGFGPRFLHSTGQLHKGGPDSGLFLQIVDEPGEELAIPETEYSFGTLIKAQALGDYRALLQRGRRALRINLGEDIKEGCQQLKSLIRDL